MGCCGDREKGLTVTEEQKWDYITLSDFKSTSCLAPLSYGWLWILVLVSIAVYVADAFTAISLLAFNKWSSQVKPKIEFDIAKWIFAICIIISYVFLAYRWMRAIRVMRSGGIVESYLEPLAAIYQCMRITKSGQGWRRFLVFTELTRSKKGVDYIALFVYFQFKGALIIVVAQGPRIVINAFTLWAVMEAQIIPTGDHAAPKDRSPVAQFFINIENMAATGNKQETIIYFTMLFSLVIWVIAALSLLFSVIFYIFFLWHIIPSSDGRLSKYCRRKIEGRLERIVSKKVRKALEKQDLKRRKEEQKSTKKGDAPSQRVPTLPKVGGPDDDTSSVFSMARSDTLSTTTTLPSYSSNGPSRMNTTSTTRTGGMKQPSLPSLFERPAPSRTNTEASAYSNASYSSNAPLLGQPGSMGLSSPIPPMPPVDRNADYFNPHGNRPVPQGLPSRPYSPMSQGRASPRPPRSPLPPVNTDYYEGRVSPSPQLISPLPSDPRGPPPSRGNTSFSPNGRMPGPGRNFGAPRSDRTFSPYDNRGPIIGPAYEMSPVDMTPVDNKVQHSYSGSNGSDEYRAPQLPSALRPGSPAQTQAMNNNFASPPPPRSITVPPTNPRAGLPAALQSAIQRREASNPLPNRNMNGSVPQQRSATAPIQQPGWGQGPAPRSNTTRPGPTSGYPAHGMGQPRGSEDGW
ncbi:uncharacterized protein BDR25DRAFT_14270 [Lindgomyces ingoldianus]|uniref:Uncharacterized protein n=1 Tax=Lindgomyces ingoldianus TaxID=673940 RepID=A0ACB6R1N4_9PLEO|nr:uncharacterized protein BDR25DRAFT_14270 [Lindgomyces ingoldianus]KAF2472422.1 hypothetical protein BDR25DRAFT_14270 [Lindgomyces ingoldianus]